MNVPKSHLTAIMKWAERTIPEDRQHTLRLLALKNVQVNGAVLAMLITAANTNPVKNNNTRAAIDEAVYSAIKSLTPAK